MADALKTPRRATLLAANERFRWWLSFSVLAMLAAARAAMATERDPYWSARAGLETLDGVPLARPDTWSWSTEGIWYPNSPAWNVLLGAAWNALGFWGFFWVTFASFAILVGLAMIVASRTGARALPTVATFLPLLVASSAALSARATVVVQILLFIAVIFGWWWGGRAARFHVVPAAGIVAGSGFALSFAGNWVHLSFMLLAAVISLMWAAAWWASPNLDTPRRLALSGAGGAGLFFGCLLSPYGIGVTLARAGAVSDACRELIAEWMSLPTMVVREGTVIWLPIALGAVAAATGTLIWFVRLFRREGRFDPRVRLVLPMIILAIPAILAGLISLRFLPLGILMLMPAAAAAVTSLVDRFRIRLTESRTKASRRLGPYVDGRFWTYVLLAVALESAVVAAIMVPQGARPPELQLAERLPHGCQLWSDPSVAGPVLLARPDVKVWIDGRADYYGRSHLLEYFRIRAGRDPLPEMTGCVILSSIPANIPLAHSLDATDAWTRVRSVDGFTLWLPTGN